MPNCELCGTEDELITAIVEGSTLQLCRRCKEFGDIIALPQQQAPQPKPKVAIPEPEEYIADDYGAQIKTTREKLGITQKDLAEKIKEKESVIHKLESGHMKPNAALAMKLERFLGIKLIEQYSPEDKSKIDFKDKGLTIGDLVKLKKK